MLFLWKGAARKVRAVQEIKFYTKKTSKVKENKLYVQVSRKSNFFYRIGATEELPSAI